MLICPHCTIGLDSSNYHSHVRFCPHNPLNMVRVVKEVKISENDGRLRLEFWRDQKLAGVIDADSLNLSEAKAIQYFFFNL